MKIINPDFSRLEELTDLFEKYRAFYKKESDYKGAKEFVSERLTNKDSVFYMSIDETGAATGFIQLYPIFSSTRLKKHWLLNDLYVEETHRKKGIAKCLIDMAKQHAVKTNAIGLLLETAKDNTKANKLYLKESFELDHANYYFWDVRKAVNENI